MTSPIVLLEILKTNLQLKNYREFFPEIQSRFLLKITLNLFFIFFQISFLQCLKDFFHPTCIPQDASSNSFNIFLKTTHDIKFSLKKPYINPSEISLSVTLEILLDGLSDNLLEFATANTSHILLRYPSVKIYNTKTFFLF